MSELRSCIVSSGPRWGHAFLGVTAETLYEAAILGMKAMKAENWENAPNLEIEVREPAPEIRHTVWNSVLSAWSARHGKAWPRPSDGSD
jgi:hypothetical protein